MGNWWDDPDEVLAFAKWYFDVSHVATTHILHYFEKPWKWDEKHDGYEEDKRIGEGPGIGLRSYASGVELDTPIGPPQHDRQRTNGPKEIKP